MYEMLKGGFKDDKDRKKELCGEKFELTVLRAYEELELGNEIVYHPYGYRGRVDFKWQAMSAELEAKRLMKTKYCNCSWLKENIVDRFTDDTVRFRIAVVTAKKWSKIEDDYLKSNNIWVIETGQINNEQQSKRAMRKFKDGLADFIIAKTRN
jgi:hypothetical protein